MNKLLGYLTILSMTLLSMAPVFAADGDTLSTIIAERTGTSCASTNAQGDHSSVGVGIAFDGTNLLVSCYGDSTISVIDPTDGSQLEVISTTASGLGAIAWDQGRGLLWSCSGGSSIGTIDLATGTFTSIFSGSCFDGLAYDSSDDSIWASADASFPVRHFTSSGTLIASFNQPPGWSGSGNSGIAVGGANLYLANNGSSQIYVVDKAFTSATLFYSSNRRQEGLECDNVTFSGAGKTAMWTVDAYDNVLNALEIPNGSCSFGGGGGNGGAAPTPPQAVPTLSTWGVVTTLMLFAIFGFGYFQRRKT